MQNKSTALGLQSKVEFSGWCLFSLLLSTYVDGHYNISIIFQFIGTINIKYVNLA
jgi:hypothetical protein